MSEEYTDEELDEEFDDEEDLGDVDDIELGDWWFIDDIGDVLDETPEADVEGYLGDFETLLELADL